MQRFKEKMNIQKATLAFLPILFVAYFFLSPVFADPTQETEIGEKIHGGNTFFTKFTKKVFGFDNIGDQGAPSLPDLIIRVLNLVFSLLGIILVIVIIWSGFDFMTAGGESEKAKKARGRLINACIGAGIVVLAWSISWGVMKLIAEYILKSP